ncbi:hypothetical protein BDN67DRAFT_985508 [Paxillus ammoniavirescens]|nr:hypothetical protein BDN67DRAFT_985508 [Paxillus ammoniavirescens]
MQDNIIISASFHVNINQTNIIYQPANQNRLQWWVKKKNGKSKHSLPSPKSPGYEEVAKLRHVLVNIRNNLDVWVVHCSVAFQTWLDKNYSWIRYQFVPAGITGIAQPCEEGSEMPNMMISWLRHCHNLQLEHLQWRFISTLPREPYMISLSSDLSTHSMPLTSQVSSNRAFALCKAGADNKFNLSYIPQMNPLLWQRIQLHGYPDEDEVGASAQVEDVLPDPAEDKFIDDAPLETVLQHIASAGEAVQKGYTVDDSGLLVVTSAANVHEDVLSDSSSAVLNLATRLRSLQYGLINNIYKGLSEDPQEGVSMNSYLHTQMIDLGPNKYCLR